MKKLLLIAAILLSVTGYGQELNKSEVFAGIGISNSKTSEGMMDPVGGVMIGFSYRAMLYYGAAQTNLMQLSGLYANSGITFLQKGFKWNLENFKYLGLTSTSKGSIKTTYLEVPLHLGYLFNPKQKYSLFAEAGGYLGFGLTGKYKSKINYGGTDFEYNHKFFKVDDGELQSGNRFEFGIGVKAGVDIQNNITVSAGYDLGLTKYGNAFFLSPKHRKFYMTVGYRF
ncbi:MAG: PorT family protein [Bacteroidales bacterium]|nr:PorT family protein [Bacteroidales bacterium]